MFFFCSPEVRSVLLVMWRDAPLSAIKPRFSCSQSDRDATTFSLVVLLGGRKNFHMNEPSPMPFCQHFPCLLHKNCTTSKLLVRQSMRTSTALSNSMYSSQGVNFDFTGMGDTPCTRSYPQLGCVSTFCRLPQNYFVSLVRSQPFPYARYSQLCNFLF